MTKFFPFSIFVPSSSLSFLVDQENCHFEKEKIDNQSFIAWKCCGQSTNHVVKSPHTTPRGTLFLGLLLVALYSLFDFSRKLKIPLTKIIPHKIIN